MTIRFFLKSTKKAAVPVWVRVKCGKDADLSASLPKAMIDPSLWDSKRNAPKTFNKATQPDLYAQSAALSKYLDAVRSDIVVAVDACAERDEAFTRERLAEIAGREVKKESPTDKAPQDMLKYCAWLIDRMEDGQFLNGSTPYDHDTIKTWRVFYRVLSDFRANYESGKGKVLRWDSINKVVYDAFLAFLGGRGYTVKSQNKLIICWKALIRYASSYHGLHDNLGCLAVMRRIPEVAGCSTTKIYLTTDEIQALYDMPLEPGSMKDKVRDLFLIGVYTCQRVSDYNNLSALNFCTTARGTKVIRLTQEKTDNAVVVPILNDNLQAIAEKYDYHFPRVCDVIINRYIKEIAKELSKTVPSLAESVRTILTLPERRAEEEGRLHFERDEAGNVIRPRYELVCTHTARRSGITNLYKSRLFSTLQLMSISGHKSERNFFLYVRESSDELADEIAGIMEAAKTKAVASNEGLF